MIDFAKEIISNLNPEGVFLKAIDNLQTVFKLRVSGKHMSGRDLGRLEETNH